MWTFAIVSFIVDILQPYRHIIYPAFFLGFFVATLVALVFHRNQLVRSTYVAGFFALLLVVNLAIPVHLVPIMHWHKFSEPYPEELVWHQVRLVDEDGQEIIYDDKGTMGVDGVRMERLQRWMRTEYSDQRNCEVVRWLLERAEAYRDRVLDRPVYRWLRFPPHGLNDQWTREDLHGYGEFVGIRIYEQQVVTSADGQEVLSYTERVVFEHADPDTVPDRCGVESALGRASVEP